MSPEQATGDRDPDARSDVYSPAAVLYEMLAGEPPHTGSTVQAVIAKVLTEPVKPVRDIRQSVPVHVALAVERALAKIPADRFDSAADFAEALHDPTVMMSGAGAGAQPPELATPPDADDGRCRRDPRARNRARAAASPSGAHGERTASRLRDRAGFRRHTQLPGDVARRIDDRVCGDRCNGRSAHGPASR